VDDLGLGWTSDLLRVFNELVDTPPRELSVRGLADSLDWDEERVRFALVELAKEGLAYWSKAYGLESHRFPFGTLLFVGQFAPHAGPVV
jgi:hypothetical protein